jgi:DNA-binding NarL/FixJ family response regulator
MKKLAIFLVDDHSVVRAGIRMLIDAQPDMAVVGEASDGSAIVAAVARSGADVVLMDVSMPRVSGARATKELKEALPHVVVLALTRHGERAYLQQMIDCGASGYVLKQAAAGELLGAIRIASCGGTYLDPSIAGKVVHSSRREQVRAQLTAREREVATMIALGHTNKEVAATLGISVKTVEAHKARLMEKLDISSRAELVRFAMMQDWLSPDAK